MSKQWYPIIDKEKCVGCLDCYNFCPHGVFEVGEDSKPVVANADSCVDFCRGCAKICPQDAITYFGDEGE